MTPKSPGARLLAAAGYARQGKFIADVGTDHAYLPVYLAEAGVSAGAVATDINRGPLERAAANVAAAGLSDKITLRLADGLDGVEAFCPEDIFILGMGGELIARILGNSDSIKNENIRLILQPMTRQAALRRFPLWKPHPKAARLSEIMSSTGRNTHFFEKGSNCFNFLKASLIVECFIR